MLAPPLGPAMMGSRRQSLATPSSSQPGSRRPSNVGIINLGPSSPPGSRGGSRRPSGVGGLSESPAKPREPDEDRGPRFKAKRTDDKTSRDISGDLQQAAVFANFDPVFLKRLTEYMAMDMLSPGDVIIRQGEEGDKMYFLYRGSVEVIANGTRVATLGSGSIFGEMALFGEKKRTATIKALELSDVRSIDHTFFQVLVQKFPEEQSFFQNLAAVRKKELSELTARNPVDGPSRVETTESARRSMDRRRSSGGGHSVVSDETASFTGLSIPGGDDTTEISERPQDPLQELQKQLEERLQASFSETPRGRGNDGETKSANTARTAAPAPAQQPNGAPVQATPVINFQLMALQEQDPDEALSPGLQEFLASDELAQAQLAAKSKAKPKAQVSVGRRQMIGLRGRGSLTSEVSGRMLSTFEENATLTSRKSKLTLVDKIRQDNFALRAQVGGIVKHFKDGGAYAPPRKRKETPRVLPSLAAA